MASRTLLGRMSFHITSISARQSARVPDAPSEYQPAGRGMSAAHTEYCCSSFITTRYFRSIPRLLSSFFKRTSSIIKNNTPRAKLKKQCPGNHVNQIYSE
jgi:hypothetical protein